jgi:hypothetical protein
MSFYHLLKLSYYFDSNAWSTFPGFWIFFGVALAALVASVVLKIQSKKMAYSKREVIARITGPVFLVSWLFLLWMFLRYEGVPYLSWRFWPVLMFIYLIVAAVLLVKFIRVELPKKKEKRVTGSDVKQHYLRRFAGKLRAGGSKQK